MAVGKVHGCKGGAGDSLAYLTQQEKQGHQREENWTHGLNMAGEDQQEWLQEMEARRALNERCEKPYAHLSVSFDPEKEGQDITNQRIFDYAEKYLKKMGLKDHQAIMVVHRDTEHPHVHILANRIGEDGKAWNDSFSRLRSVEAVKETSAEFGYDIVKQKHDLSLNRGDIERLGRGQTSWKAEIQTRVTDAIERSNGKWEDFKHRLEDNGVETRINANKTGLSYRLKDIQDEHGEDIVMKASKIGKKYQLPALEEKLETRLQYVIERELSLKEAWKNGDDLDYKQTLDEAIKEDRNYGEKHTRAVERTFDGEIRRHESPLDLGADDRRNSEIRLSARQESQRLESELRLDAGGLEAKRDTNDERLRAVEEGDRRALERHGRSEIQSGSGFDDEFRPGKEALELREKESREKFLHVDDPDSVSAVDRIRDLADEDKIRRFIVEVGRVSGQPTDHLRPDQRFKAYEQEAEKLVVQEVMKEAPEELKKACLSHDAKAFSEAVFGHVMHEAIRQEAGKEVEFLASLSRSESGKEASQKALNFAISLVPGGSLVNIARAAAKVELEMEREAEPKQKIDGLSL